ncbi:MAG TPA: serine hydrolase domain-containing protein [Actinomycetota bacterium]|jgi:CubicO group peptidase (beta-lactamase class C family)|nr:serine hydrolase domain-containing protein [Actinomycetota bacterium]
MTRRWDRDPVRTGLAQAVEDAARQALATSRTPGLAVALVHHGQLVWAAGYGLADLATGQPVTATTRFQAASLSKPVTAWGVLRLVESGRIGLDEPIIGHLRRWRPPPSPIDADGLTVRRLLSHTAGLSVHGYVGQPSDRPLPPIAASLSGETGDSFPVELLEAPGRGWLYSGGGYSLLQLLAEELTGRPFADYTQTEVLGPLGMTASSFRWSRTAETARPHDADGGPLPDFTFAEQAAAGLVTTAPDLARFVAAALAGRRGEPPGRGVLSPASVRLALTAAPATEGRWGLGYGLGLTPSGDLLAYHEGANRGWRAGLALLPDRRAGIVVLANGDDGSRPIDAVVQQWLALATPNQTHARLRTAMLAILTIAAAAALGVAKRRRTQRKPWRPPETLSAFATATWTWWCRGGPRGRGGVRLGWCRGGRPGSRRTPG